MTTVSASTRAFFGRIKRQYGVTEIEYRALFFAQGGACYVCRKAKGRTRRLGVDHNHITGEVRGLLCTGSHDAKTCNRLIAILGRAGLERGLQQLGYEVTLTRVGPPARLILELLRAGETTLPFLYKEGTFELSDIGGVDLSA